MIGYQVGRRYFGSSICVKDLVERPHHRRGYMLVAELRVLLKAPLPWIYRDVKWS